MIVWETHCRRQDGSWEEDAGRDKTACLGVAVPKSNSALPQILELLRTPTLTVTQQRLFLALIALPHYDIALKGRYDKFSYTFRGRIVGHGSYRAVRIYAGMV